jgi:hypothetical protein
MPFLFEFVSFLNDTACSAISSLAKLLVIINIASLQIIVFPLPSVNLPFVDILIFIEKFYYSL